MSSRPSDRNADEAPEPWRSAITCCDDESVWYQGFDVTALMRTSTFADIVFLLHKGRLPLASERRLIDAMLISVADHGPGSPSAIAMRTVATGNRVAPEAAIAAGILAIGDAHGGAGLACLTLITASLTRSRTDGEWVAGVADRVALEARQSRTLLP